MNGLYVDGGVIAANPSLIGGTYAWCQVVDDMRTVEGMGVISPSQAQMPAVSNNLTEMLALVKGLESLPEDWKGEVFSDSQITLGRAFTGWKWTHIPTWLHLRYSRVREYLVYFDRFEYTLLAGHPTKVQLAAGVGRHGYPVSVHNVWCDDACRRAGEYLLTKAESEITLGQAVPA